MEPRCWQAPRPLPSGERNPRPVTFTPSPSLEALLQCRATPNRAVDTQQGSDQSTGFWALPRDRQIPIPRLGSKDWLPGNRDREAQNPSRNSSVLLGRRRVERRSLLCHPFHTNLQKAQQFRPLQQGAKGSSSWHVFPGSCFIFLEAQTLLVGTGFGTIPWKTGRSAKAEHTRSQELPVPDGNV